MQISRSLLSNPALKAATVLAVSALALTACTNASETGTRRRGLRFGQRRGQL